MPTTLSSKLQLKAGQALFVLNAPDECEQFLSAQMPEISLISAPYDVTQAVLVFVKTLAEARRFIPQVISVVEPDGLFWLAYPKGTSKVATDVNRDILYNTFQPLGVRFVRQVAINDIWSAMRFRPPSQSEEA
jgi:hypothetical protein